MDIRIEYGLTKETDYKGEATGRMRLFLSAFVYEEGITVEDSNKLEAHLANAISDFFKCKLHGKDAPYPYAK